MKKYGVHGSVLRIFAFFLERLGLFTLFCRKKRCVPLKFGWVQPLQGNFKGDILALP